MPVYGAPVMGAPVKGKGMGKEKGGYEESETAAPASLLVSLPEDARLLVDSYETKSTSGQRTFVTPDLETGRDYQYTLTAEVVRDGRVQRVSRTVTVRAGEQTAVTLQLPEAVASR
jgi:uncharacterized protein (TIGR03000 family)